MFYLYIIRCEDDYLYVGIANNIDKRIQEHRSGLCINTKNRGRISLVYTERFTTRAKAAKRERN